MNSTTPENARWETWDRNRLIKLVEKLPDSVHINISHNNERNYSVYRVWGSYSVHLTFGEGPNHPHAVFITKIHGPKHETKSVEWLSGGLRAWIDALEINRDDLLEALL
jgi:hypothetical protein